MSTAEGASSDTKKVEYELTASSAAEADAKPSPDKNESKDNEPELPPVSLFDLFRYATPRDYAMSMCGVTCALVNGFAFPAFCIAFGELIDGAYDPDTSKAADEMRKASFYFFYIAIGTWTLSMAQLTFAMYSAERQGALLRKHYFQSVIYQDISWHDMNKTNEINANILSQTLSMQQGFGEKLAMMLQYLATVVSSFVIGFVLGWQLALVQSACVPLMAFAGALFTKSAMMATQSGQKSYSEAGGIAQEALGNSRTVAAFSAEDSIIQRYAHSLVAALKGDRVKAIYSGMGNSTFMFAIFGSYALGLWYGGVLISNQTENPYTGDPYTGGDVMLVFFVIIIGAMTMGNLAQPTQTVTSARVTAAGVYKIIERVPEIDANDQKGEKPKNVSGSISFENVSFTYPSRKEVPVLKNFSFDINAGARVALVGSSGSGKSTIVQLVQRFYDPHEGAVRLDGTNLKNLNVAWLRSQMGLVSQEPTLFAVSIEENIRFGKPGATKEQVIEAAKKANAHDFIMKLPKQYDTYVGEKGAQISGGQKQRIAIARAIIRNPSILLLDEATSALDSENESIVQEALDRLMKGRTTIVVAHRLSTVRDADCIIVMKRGEIVESGTHSDLLQKQGVYAELVQHQLTGGAEPASSPKAESSSLRDIEVDSTVGHAAEGGVVPTDNAAVQETAEKEDEYKVSLKRVAMYNRPELWMAVVGLVFVFGMGIIWPVYAYLLTEMLLVLNLCVEEEVDGVTYFGDYLNPDDCYDEIKEDSLVWVFAFVGLAVGAGLSMALSIGTFGVMGANMTNRIRREVFEHFIRMHVGWFDSPKHSTGALTGSLATDVPLIECAMGGQFSVTLGNLVTIVVAVALAFVYSWELTLLMFATIPMFYLAAKMEVNVLAGFAHSSRESHEEAAKVAGEAISSMRTVASFGAESRLVSAYEEQLQKPVENALRVSMTAGFSLGFAQCLFILVYFPVFLVAAELIEDGSRDIDDIMKAFFLLAFAGMGMGNSSGFAPNIAKGKAAISSVFRLLDEPSEIDPAADDVGKKPKDLAPVVDLKHVKFSYPSRKDAPPLFEDLSLHVAEGETVALVGSSGCGKSSIVGLLERFYDVDGGEVCLGGVDIRTLNVKYLRSQIGLVGQEPVLFTASVKENILMGRPGASDEEVVEAAKAANAHKFIMDLPDKYDTVIKGTQLSGGQKQRVAIARAVIRNPKILLLDEATSALDAESEVLVQEALDRISKDATTIVIAHRLSTVKNADRIVVLQDGKVVEEGTHTALLEKDGAYANLVRRQAEV
eukprot:Rmarinus@m.8921